MFSVCVACGLRGWRQDVPLHSLIHPELYTPLRSQKEYGTKCGALPLKAL
jgi:hypothetical protein